MIMFDVAYCYACGELVEKFLVDDGRFYCQECFDDEGFDEPEDDIEE